MLNIIYYVYYTVLGTNHKTIVSVVSETHNIYVHINKKKTLRKKIYENLNFGLLVKKKLQRDVQRNIQTFSQRILFKHNYKVDMCAHVYTLYVCIWNIYSLVHTYTWMSYTKIIEINKQYKHYALTW